VILDPLPGPGTGKALVQAVLGSLGWLDDQAHEEAQGMTGDDEEDYVYGPLVERLAASLEALGVDTSSAEPSPQEVEQALARVPGDDWRLLRLASDARELYDFISPLCEDYEEFVPQRDALHAALTPYGLPQ
jgi:hypothetical protein